MTKFSPSGVDSYAEGDAGKKELKDGFVSVDIGMLSHHHQQQQQQYVQNDKDFTKSPRITVVKNFTRKGSLRSGERNNNKAASSPEGDVHTGGPAGGDVMTHVAVDAEAALLPNASTPTAASMAVRSRRAAAGGAGGRRSSSWLDPRRVVLFFATLSSVGTLILLYFTLSMGKMSDGDANAR